MQECDGARQWTRAWQQLLIDLAVTLLKQVRLLCGQRLTGFARHGTREESAAHANAAMHAPAVDRQPRFVECLLPSKHVSVHRVDERPIDIKDQRAHGERITLSRFAARGPRFAEITEGA